MIEKPQPFVQPDMILSVSNAAQLLKSVVETAFPRLRIRGELSQVKPYSSGHTYFTIKDSDAAISGIIWRGTPIKCALEDGIEVIATGRITTYPARSNYQIIVSEMEMAGAGAILKMLEERKKKLAAEGLFDAARKKTLPRFPQTIGIITSPQGAAFQDICNRLRERFPVRVLLYPAQVQGASAASEVAAGIEYFNREQNVDVIIVARGGGALEDLLPFSEEIIVRAAAASRIPLVSGVGHEPDWMLIDFAADVRVPTPTGAAEIVVPTKISLFQEIENLSHRLSSAHIAKLKNIRAAVGAIEIKSPRQMIMERAQRLDDAGRAISIIINGKIAAAKQAAAALPGLQTLANNRIAYCASHIMHMGRMLDSLSYKSVLNRGYAIVRAGEKIVKSKADFARPATIEFADGIVNV